MKQEPETVYIPLAKMKVEMLELDTQKAEMNSALSESLIIAGIANKIVETARKYVGIKETGGNNQGELIQKFQKAVDGVAQGEPYCLGFCQFVANEVCEHYEVTNPLFKTEHCQTLFDKTQPIYRRAIASEGTIFIKKNRTSMNGHAGINTNGGTIEGNTNDGTSRDGDGVYEKFSPIADDRTKFVRGNIDLPRMIYDQIKTKQRGKAG